MCIYHQQHEKTLELAYLALTIYGTPFTATALNVESILKSHSLKTTFSYHSNSNCCPMQPNEHEI